jgi:hypothetical protein
MLRLAAPAALLLAALAAPPSSALLPGVGGPCPAPDFIAGTQLVSAPGGQWLRATFEATQPVTGTFWGVVGATVATTGGLYGFFGERALVAAFFEDAQGKSLGTPGLALYPYGIEADAAGMAVRVLAGELRPCGGAGAGLTLTLQPGTYRVVVLGSTETGSGAGAALPLGGITVLSTETGPLTRLFESGYACAQSARVEALGFASEVLMGCANAYTAAGTAYRAVFMSHFPDANHAASWTAPGGATQSIVIFDLNKGPAGTWTLNIPRYITPLGQPFGVPGPVQSESGVFGAFASVP